MECRLKRNPGRAGSAVEQPPPQGFCYDTRLPGNGNGGHVYGAALSPPEKDDLIAYLLTF